MISSFERDNNWSCSSRRFSLWARVSRATIEAAEVNRVRYPAAQAFRPRATARCVLPTPGGPSSSTFSDRPAWARRDRKSTRLNSSHQIISYAVFCLKKKKIKKKIEQEVQNRAVNNKSTYDT